MEESAKVELCRRGQRSYFDAVFKLTKRQNKKVASRAFSLLQCLDKERARRYYFELFNTTSTEDRLYDLALGILLFNYDGLNDDLYPYLIKFYDSPSNWPSAKSNLIQFGDPRGLLILQDIQSKLDSPEYQKYKYLRSEIKEAIETLKMKLETKSNSSAPAA